MEIREKAGLEHGDNKISGFNGDTRHLSTAQGIQMFAFLQRCTDIDSVAAV